MVFEYSVYIHYTFNRIKLYEGESTMKDKLISFFSRFKLMIVDILIISASWELVTLVSHTSI